MHRPGLLLGLAALAANIYAASASAALIALDLFTASDGLITRDTETGLDWLDLTATTNLTYNDIEADVGGWFSLGFRHATGGEVCGLFVTYAGVPTRCPGSVSAIGAVVDPTLVQALQALIGVTFSARVFEGSIGYFDDGDVSNGVGSASVQYVSSSSSGRSDVRRDVALATQTSGSSGHWLVRPVPEPSTGLLVAAGLTAFAVRRRP